MHDVSLSGCIGGCIQDCAESRLARKHACVSMQLMVCLCSYQDTFSGADNKADEAGNKAKGERRPADELWGCSCASVYAESACTDWRSFLRCCLLSSLPRSRRRRGRQGLHQGWR